MKTDSLELQKLKIFCPSCNSRNIDYDSFHFNFSGIEILYICLDCMGYFNYEIRADNSEFNNPEIKCLKCGSNDVEFNGLKLEDTYDLTIELICIHCDYEFVITDISVA